MTGERRSQTPFVDFEAINRAAMSRLPDILGRWLPGGRTKGHEYTVRNPRRNDHKPGSFRINLNTGRWGDFATNDRGGDPVSLAAYLFNLSQMDAARKLADMLGVPVDGK